MSEHSGGKMEDSQRIDGIVAEEDVSKLLRHFVKTSHRVKNADIKVSIDGSIRTKPTDRH